MPLIEKDPSMSQNRLRSSLACLVCLVVLMVAGGCGGERENQVVDWRARLSERIAALRAEGQPVTLREALALREPIPEADNAALLCLQAFAKMEKRNELRVLSDMLVSSEPGAQPSELLMELSRQHLEANAEALALLAQAAQLLRGAYLLQSLDEASGLVLEHAHDMWRASWLCAVDAVVHAQAQQPDEAARSVITMRRLAGSVGDRPMLVELESRMAVETVVVGTLERTLELCEMSTDDLATLQREVEMEEAQLDLGPVLQAERAGMLPLFQARANMAYETLTRGAKLSTDPRAVDVVLAILAEDGVYYLDLHDRWARICTLPERERLQQAILLQQEIDARLNEEPAPYASFMELDKLLRQHADDPPKALRAYRKKGLCRHPLTRTLLPAFGRVLQRVAAARTRLRLARTALGCELWRMEHGAWPESLAELVPDYLGRLPEDPFGAGPLTFERTADGVAVRSTGSGEGIDDSEQTELSFRLLGPESRRTDASGLREEAIRAGVTIPQLRDLGLNKDRLLELGFAEYEMRRMEEWR